MQRVLAVALQRDTAYHLALAVEFGNAAAFPGAELDARDIAQKHRRAALHLESDLFKVLAVAQIAAAAHDIFGLGHLDHAAADIAVAGADGGGDLGQSEAVGLQLLRVDDYLVLLDETADTGDFGNTFGLGEL